MFLLAVNSRAGRSPEEGRCRGGCGGDVGRGEWGAAGSATSTLPLLSQDSTNYVLVLTLDAPFLCITTPLAPPTAVLHYFT